MRWHIAGILALFFLAPQVCSQPWENLRVLRPGDGIQVIDQQLRERKGRFVSMTQDVIVYETTGKKRKGPPETVTVTRGDVFRISSAAKAEQRHRRVMLGVGLGAVAGAALLGGIAAAGCCNSDYTAAFVIGGAAAIGAGAGAAVGAVAGTVRAPSDTLYRGERRRR